MHKKVYSLVVHLPFCCLETFMLYILSICMSHAQPSVSLTIYCCSEPLKPLVLHTPL